MPWLRMVMVALIGAGAAGVVGAKTAKPAGTVTAGSGAVTVRRFAATPRPVKFGEILYWGDVVEAHKDGCALLRLGGRTTVTVRELSRLKLQEEARTDRVRYALELVWGKLRVSVAQMLVHESGPVEVWTRNAVASVRGTDFIVETEEQPAQEGTVTFLGAREVVQGAEDSRSRSVETVVTTLSGLVEVSNRLSGTGRVERIGASETLRVSGAEDPVRLGNRVEDLKRFSQGPTCPGLNG